MFAFICICIHLLALFRTSSALHCPFCLFGQFAASTGGKHFSPFLTALRVPACFACPEGQGPLGLPWTSCQPALVARALVLPKPLLRKFGQAANLSHCTVEPPASPLHASLYSAPALALARTALASTLSSINTQALALSSTSTLKH